MVTYYRLHANGGSYCENTKPVYKRQALAVVPQVLCRSNAA